MKIEVQYTGKSPNLCSGRLTLVVDGQAWEFPYGALCSGGEARVEGRKEIHETGAWGVAEWPEDFPEAAKEAAIEAINANIPWGCCGGCI